MRTRAETRARRKFLRVFVFVPALVLIRLVLLARPLLPEHKPLDAYLQLSSSRGDAGLHPPDVGKGPSCTLDSTVQDVRKCPSWFPEKLRETVGARMET